MLAQILKDRLTQRNLSVRAAAIEIGVAHTTLTRVLTGGNYDLDTVFALSKWLEIKPAELLSLEPIDDVSLLFSSVPGLKEVIVEAAAKVNSGEMEVSDLADIVSYAKYKIRERSQDGKH